MIYIFLKKKKDLYTIEDKKSQLFLDLWKILSLPRVES